MSRYRRKSTRTIARESYALALAAPEVVAHRLGRMWVAGNNPSHRDRLELYRMSSEKVAAFYESWNAMFLALCRTNVQIMFSLMSGPWAAARTTSLSRHLATQGQRAMAEVLAAGLAPVRRRAVANVRRLRRSRT